MDILVYDYSTFTERLVVQVNNHNARLPSIVNKMSVSLITEHLYCVLDPGNGKVVAPIIRFDSAKNIVQPSALLVSSDEYDSLLMRFVHIIFHRLCAKCP